MWKIPLFDLSYDTNEIKAVNEVLESKWLTAGPKVKEFEDKFEKYLEQDVKCCAVSSCTAALHMALLLNHIKSEDEVIVSGLNFIAAMNAITLVGAKPVLADSKSLEDWNVSVDDIASKITERTKAIIVVHFAGYPCDMNELVRLAKEYKLILIEDVAHAIGGEYRNQKCGTFGDIACFSFFSNKNLSTGEGGMIVTKSKEFDEKARLLRSHGMTSLTIDRHEGKTISYDVIQPGLNYRLDEIRAALGITQLSKLNINNTKREYLVKKYIEILSKVEEIVIPWKNLNKQNKSSYHIFPILLPENVDRKRIMNVLKEYGIQTSIHYPSYKDFYYYKNLVKQKLYIAEEISKRVLTLPLYPDMTFENVEYVCQVLKEAL